MKIRSILLNLAFIVGIISLLSGLSLADKTDQAPVNWETDIVKAQEKAKQQGKPILLLFTGTKWCGVCQLLEKNVLSKPEFADYVKDRFILVKEEYTAAYFDEKPAAGSLDSKQLDQIELAKRFNVNVGQPNVHGLNGYPSIFLLSPEGKNMEHLNTNVTVSQGSVESFLNSLDTELTKHAQEIQPPATQPVEASHK